MVLELLTENARKSVFFAEDAARSLGWNQVQTEHLLLGLLRATDSVAYRTLDRGGVSPLHLHTLVLERALYGSDSLQEKRTLHPHAKRAMDYAYDESRQLSNSFIGTEHLLLGLLREKDGLAGNLLRELGMDLERTRDQFRAIPELRN